MVEWFRTFDERRLNFVHQEHKADGSESNFFRLENAKTHRSRRATKAVAELRPAGSDRGGERRRPPGRPRVLLAGWRHTAVPALAQPLVPARPTRPHRQRALRRELFEPLVPDYAHGYRIEAGLNSPAKARGLTVVSFVCDGLWHRPKEQKLGPLRGFAAKVSMLATAVLAYVTWRVRSRRGVPGRRAIERLTR